MDWESSSPSLDWKLVLSDSELTSSAAAIEPALACLLNGKKDPTRLSDSRGGGCEVSGPSICGLGESCISRSKLSICDNSSRLDKSTCRQGNIKFNNPSMWQTGIVRFSEFPYYWSNVWTLSSVPEVFLRRWPRCWVWTWSNTDSRSAELRSPSLWGEVVGGRARGSRGGWRTVTRHDLQTVHPSPTPASVSGGCLVPMTNNIVYLCIRLYRESYKMLVCPEDLKNGVSNKHFCYEW